MSYIYIQELRPRCLSQHDLAMHKKRSIKDLARGVDGGLDLCIKQTNIEITPGTLYVTKNLSLMAVQMSIKRQEMMILLPDMLGKKCARHIPHCNSTD